MKVVGNSINLSQNEEYLLIVEPDRKNQIATFIFTYFPKKENKVFRSICTYMWTCDPPVVILEGKDFFKSIGKSFLSRPFEPASVVKSVVSNKSDANGACGKDQPLIQRDVGKILLGLSEFFK